MVITARAVGTDQTVPVGVVTGTVSESEKALQDGTPGALEGSEQAEDSSSRGRTACSRAAEEPNRDEPKAAPAQAAAAGPGSFTQSLNAAVIPDAGPAALADTSSPVVSCVSSTDSIATANSEPAKKLNGVMASGTMLLNRIGTTAVLQAAKQVGGQNAASQSPHAVGDRSGAGDESQPTNAAGSISAPAGGQHSGDAIQGSTAGIADQGTAVAQSVSPQLAIQNSDAAPSAGPRLSEVPHAPEPPRTVMPIPTTGSEGAAVSGINTARLVQTIGETGMHIGLRSADFGDISIRTLVSQQQMTAQISVNHSDLGRAIAAHVPAMQSKLDDEFGLRASIQVSHTEASFAGQTGDSSASQQRPQPRVIPQAVVRNTTEPETVSPHWVQMDDSNRLDIRA